MAGLTVTQIRNMKPASKPQRLFDGGGLYLEVMPTGARYWRLKYRHAGKEKRLALGVFPEVTLLDARSKRDSARAVLREGRDPSAERKAGKQRATLDAGNTFDSVSKEWLGKQKATLAPITFTKAEWHLSMAAGLAGLPIASITASDVLAVLRVIEGRGAHDTAHRVKQRIGQVFRYAIATSRAETDPTVALRGALSPVVSTSRAALTEPNDVADLLRTIHAYQGQPVTCAALKLAPLLFVRPGNLRAMEWAEIDLAGGEWRIAAGKMKAREAHTVPLSTQAVAVLRELRALTGRGRYVFPSIRTGDRPMSENTVNAALRRMGYDKDTMTGHGFRALASTRLNEMGWAPDVIERQLAHAERNKVRAAYNRASYMAERGKMMQQWADYLDTLRDDTGKVTPIRKHGSKA